MSTAAVSAAPVADGGGRVRGAEGTGDAVRPAGTCFAHWASHASHHAKGRRPHRSGSGIRHGRVRSAGLGPSRLLRGKGSGAQGNVHSDPDECQRHAVLPHRVARAARVPRDRDVQCRTDSARQRPDAGNVGQFLCYKLFCPKPFPPAAEMTDEFGGTRVVRFRAAQFLCAPATRSTETTGSTTTSTTLAPSSCDFNSDERRCEGTCGNGGHCSAITSGGACECRTTPCGDADAPECNGFCGAGEACTFDLTGCRCLNIP